MITPFDLHENISRDELQGRADLTWTWTNYQLSYDYREL